MARIAFLTPQLPHPAISGGVIKSRALLEHLSARHEVRLFCLLKNDDAERVSAFRDAVPLADFHGAPVAVPRSAATFLKSLAAGLPLSVYRNRSALMHALVASDLSDVDVLFVDHFLMFQYVPEQFAGRVVLHQHNAEHVMWQRYANLAPLGLRRAAIHAEAARIRRYEREICLRSDAVLAAPNDIEALIAAGVPDDRFIETLHLGDEALLAQPDIEFAATEPRLLFVGSLDWEANRDGLLWFLEHVWPLLVSRHPGLRLTIIGRNADERLTHAARSQPGVELAGFVADLEPWYARSRVFIAPLRFGGGIKVKVVNALYRGLPVATSAIGAEGLAVTSGRELLISASAEEMALDVGLLLTDEPLWRRVRDGARGLAREKYGWRACLERVEDALYA
ncbi:MAG TPA: glycosyltransferase family 4 protein [Steroidobacteraceae bacterium]|nr:glycosyltransferase family 4 protein [Steroidobacteraceae bacterium]